MNTVATETSTPATHQLLGVAEVVELNRVNLKTFLHSQEGKFVGIDYIKNDSSERSLNGRLGVTTPLKGGTNNVESIERPYLTVYDIQAAGYRTVNLATVSRVRAENKIFDIVD
jgi:hypothetical protein